MEVVELIKALGDLTRLRILNLLSKETLCVCDLETVLEISQSNASRHLNKLKQARLITCEKRAQWVYYRVDDNVLERHDFIRELITEELAKLSQYQNDEARLKRYYDRGGDCEHKVKI